MSAIFALAVTVSVTPAVKTHRGDRPATFANEYVGFCRVLAAQSAESSDFVTADGMHAWRSTLGSADVQPALVELDL
jgi:hypothetical protein